MNVSRQPAAGQTERRPAGRAKATRRGDFMITEDPPTAGGRKPSVITRADVSTGRLRCGSEVVDAGCAGLAG